MYKAYMRSTYNSVSEKPKKPLQKQRYTQFITFAIASFSPRGCGGKSFLPARLKVTPHADEASAESFSREKKVQLTYEYTPHIVV